jgi:hypothetical protein
MSHDSDVRACLDARAHSRITPSRLFVVPHPPPFPFLFLQLESFVYLVASHTTLTPEQTILPTTHIPLLLPTCPHLELTNLSP